MRAHIFTIALLGLLALSGCVSDEQARVDPLFGDEGIEINLADSVLAAPLSPLDIYIGGAMLEPERSVRELIALTDNGIITRRGLPMEYSIPEWGAAAWQVYCATGSEQWLKQAYSILLATLRAEQELGVFGEDGGMVRGVSDRIAYSYPSWLTGADKINSLSLYNNTFHYTALEVAADMAGALGLATEMPLRLNAKTLRDNINIRFWSSPYSRYGQFIYPVPYPMLSTSADCAANAVCVLNSVAPDEMAASIVNSLPSLPDGYTEIYPEPENLPGPKASTQALMTIAAAATLNARAFNAALKALKIADNEGLLWKATIIRTIFGLNMTPNGINIAPFIPENPAATATLKSFRYRDAELTINISGIGDRIASFMIDSVASEPFIPASLSGCHSVDITMANNTIAESPHAEVSASEAEIMPVESDLYNIYVDGVLESEKVAFGSQPKNSGAIVTLVPVTDNGVEGYALKPEFDNNPSFNTVHASSITPRRPPVNLIKDRAIASRYIELAPRHNTVLTFYVNLPDSGRYKVRIVYSNPTATTARRTLGIITTNDSTIVNTPVGTLLCPPARAVDWVSTTPSTWVDTNLNEGLNRLSLTYINGTILLNRIELLKVTE